MCPEPEKPTDDAEVPTRSEQQRSRDQAEESTPETLRQRTWSGTEGKFTGRQGRRAGQRQAGSATRDQAGHDLLESLA